MPLASRDLNLRAFDKGYDYGMTSAPLADLAPDHDALRQVLEG